MKILLDTHIFLWFISEDIRLSRDKNKTILNPENEVFLSVVSIWECIIKYQLGKLPFPESPETYLPRLRSQHLIKTLAVDENTVKQLIHLPGLHKDPFDRLIICQALEHNFQIMTEDKIVLAYPNIAFCP